MDECDLQSLKTSVVGIQQLVNRGEAAARAEEASKLLKRNIHGVYHTSDGKRRPCVVCQSKTTFVCPQCPQELPFCIKSDRNCWAIYHEEHAEDLGLSAMN